MYVRGYLQGSENGRVATIEHRVHQTKTNNRTTQHNMCWTPPYACKHK